MHKADTKHIMWRSSIVISTFIFQISISQYVTTNVTQGTLKGITSTTIFNGKPYLSFKGIPYAKPPVQFYKFDAPLAPVSWNEILDATKHKSTCVFYCMIKKGIVGNEDCLYLNVYTPDINSTSKRAVMVFFHPGSFNSGSGDDDIYGPDFLIEQDVVVVTFNFRIGVAGFLSTEDENAPGNVGLKDQLMVLKWIKKNIVNFGGCPNKVTLFGVNSGSAAVHYHLLSPQSRNFFRSAIMQSGSALNSFAIEYNPKRIAFKLGEVLGINNIDTKGLVAKLKEYSVQELVTATLEVTKTLNQMNGHLSPFVPVIEPDMGQDIFLNKDPWILMRNNSIFDVPIMIGINFNETAFMTPLFLSNAEMVNENFDFFLPDDLNDTNTQKKEISSMIKKFYFNDDKVTTNSTIPLTTMTSDIFFNNGVLISSKIISNKNKAPVYKYLFTYEAPFGPIKSLFNVEKGVSHGDELGYLFYGKHFDNKYKLGSNDAKMTILLTKLWTNFAKEMNPTPIEDDDIKVLWKNMGLEDNYLNINLPMKMEKNLFMERMNFWGQLYPNYLGDV